MADEDDPTYQEILEENFDLHDERKRLQNRIEALETDLAEERTAGQDNQRRTVEIERLQNIANDARTEAAERKRENERINDEREAWARERARLETALRDKEERSPRYTIFVHQKIVGYRPCCAGHCVATMTMETATIGLNVKSKRPTSGTYLKRRSKTRISKQSYLHLSLK